MKLDLSSLHKAIAQLVEALAYCDSELARRDQRLAFHLRAGAIQAFEFTYELAVKMLRRFLEMTESNPSAVSEMSFNDLIRLGAQRGLVSRELADWQQFRKDRGTTSHTYDEAKAQEVYKSIPKFLTEARYLVAQIAKRQEGQA